MAALAEDRKRTKYIHAWNQVTPSTQLPLRPWGGGGGGGVGPLTLQFLKDLGNWLRQATGDEKFYVSGSSKIQILYKDDIHRITC